MKLIKPEIKTKQKQTEELLLANAAELSKFFDEQLKRYINDEILNFIIIVEGDADIPNNTKTFIQTHSTRRHLQGLMQDVSARIRRVEVKE